MLAVRIGDRDVGDDWLVSRQLVVVCQTKQNVPLVASTRRCWWALGGQRTFLPDDDQARPDQTSTATTTTKTTMISGADDDDGNELKGCVYLLNFRVVRLCRAASVEAPMLLVVVA